MARDKIIDVADANDQGPLRVVDRRWWARTDANEGSEEPDRGLRKPTYVEELERRVADQATALQTALADRRRSADEFEQVKTRMRRDVAREVERGKRAVLSELLEVLDNLDRAIAAAREKTAAAPEALLKGVELVRDQFLAKLEALGAIRDLPGSYGLPAGVPGRNPQKRHSRAPGPGVQAVRPPVLARCCR